VPFGPIWEVVTLAKAIASPLHRTSRASINSTTATPEARNSATSRPGRLLHSAVVLIGATRR
jgi:hypothetical protein